MTDKQIIASLQKRLEALEKKAIKGKSPRKKPRKPATPAQIAARKKFAANAKAMSRKGVEARKRLINK